MRGCETCGKPLAPNKAPGRPRRFCSDRCRKRQYDLECVDCGGRVDGTTPGSMANRDEPVCIRCAGDHYAIWTREAIIEAIHEWIAVHGEQPAATDFSPHLARRQGMEWAALRREQSPRDAYPSLKHIQGRFGSWNAAIEAVGLTPLGVGKGYTRPSTRRRAA